MNIRPSYTLKSEVADFLNISMGKFREYLKDIEAEIKQIDRLYKKTTRLLAPAVVSFILKDHGLTREDFEKFLENSKHPKQ